MSRRTHGPFEDLEANLGPEDFIENYMREHAELFRELADGLVCAGCGKVTRGPKFNLGEKHHWAEGCQSCASASQS